MRTSTRAIAVTVPVLALVFCGAIAAADADSSPVPAISASTSASTQEVRSGLDGVHLPEAGVDVSSVTRSVGAIGISAVASPAPSAPSASPAPSAAASPTSTTSVSTRAPDDAPAQSAITQQGSSRISIDTSQSRADQLARIVPSSPAPPAGTAAAGREAAGQEAAEVQEPGAADPRSDSPAIPQTVGTSASHPLTQKNTAATDSVFLSALRTLPTLPILEVMISLAVGALILAIRPLRTSAKMGRKNGRHRARANFLDAS